MRGIPIIATISVIAAALLVSGQPAPKPTEAAAPVVASSEPKPLTEEQFDELQAALKKVIAAEAELAALQERLKEAEGEVKALKAQPIRPQPVAYVTRGAPANCANGSCRVMPAQAPRQYQQRTYRNGPIRRWLGR